MGKSGGTEHDLAVGRGCVGMVGMGKAGRIEVENNRVAIQNHQDRSKEDGGGEGETPTRAMGVAG